MTLVEQAELLFNEISLQVEAIERAKQFEQNLMEYDRTLRVEETSLEEEKKQIAKDKTLIGAEKDFVARSNKELETKRKSLELEQRRILEAKVAFSELDTKIKESLAVDAKLGVTRGEREQFEREKKHNEGEWENINKEKAILAERKKAIEANEIAIENEKKRLTRISTSLNA